MQFKLQMRLLIWWWGVIPVILDLIPQLPVSDRGSQLFSVPPPPPLPGPPVTGRVSTTADLQSPRGLGPQNG